MSVTTQLTEATLNARFPRVRVANVPTPLEDAPRLSAALGGPRILIKRDDLTGLALGGNKARKLEWLLGEARAAGADCLITIGEAHSNHCRQTAAAAARVGLPCYLILTPPFFSEGQGNLLLDDLLGATMIRVESADAVKVATDDLIARLRSEGHRPHLVPVGGSTPVGAIGYVSCAIELADQLAIANVRPSSLYFSSGSGGTQSGLIAGAIAIGADYRIVGISPGSKRAPSAAKIARLSGETTSLLGLDANITIDDVTLDDRYTGPAFGVMTPECAEAIRLVARTEGILLDPAYTGKAMAGLIDHIRRGEIGRDQSVVFIHTGGTPTLFAYAAELSDSAAQRS